MVGEGEPPVAFVPSSVNFGDEAVNNSSNVRTVTLHNYQSTTITLTQPILSGEFSHQRRHVYFAHKAGSELQLHVRSGLYPDDQRVGIRKQAY